jgi:hypothetical protein
LVQGDSTMGRALVGGWMTAACIAAVVIFATAARCTTLKGKHLAELSTRVDELGSRVGNVTQRMDDSSERLNDCLLGVKRCGSARWKSVRDRLDKFNTGLDKAGGVLDSMGDKLQTGIVTK